MTPADLKLLCTTALSQHAAATRGPWRITANVYRGAPMKLLADGRETSVAVCHSIDRAHNAALIASMRQREPLLAAALVAALRVVEATAAYMDSPSSAGSNSHHRNMREALENFDAQIAKEQA